MLNSLKLKLLLLNDWFEYMALDAGRSRRMPHAGHGGGCIAARGDENSIIDIYNVLRWSSRWSCGMSRDKSCFDGQIALRMSPIVE